MLHRQEDITHRINYAVQQAAHGEGASFSAEVLLGELGLAGDDPDGFTLLDRLTAGNREVHTMRGAVTLLHNAAMLFRLTNERAANSAQEDIARALGWVLTRQVMREGNICPAAQALVEDCRRDDIIPPCVSDTVALVSDDGMQEAWEQGVIVVDVANLLEQSGGNA